jgi:hypothetical protein
MLRLLRDRNCLQPAVWRMAPLLVTSTADTISDISCDILSHGRPKEEFMDCLASLGYSIVSRSGCIMESFHDIPFQMITMFRDYYLGILDDKTLRVDTQPRRLRGTACISPHLFAQNLTFQLERLEQGRRQVKRQGRSIILVAI